MDRVKRISMQILEKHGNLFTDDFEKNKSILSEVAIIRSKQLRNEIAGYITDFVKKEGKSISGEASAEKS
ncbi:MAG: 30S ribosomal protein S17e [Nitrososphaerales archaeon]